MFSSSDASFGERIAMKLGKVQSSINIEKKNQRTNIIMGSSILSSHNFTMGRNISMIYIRPLRKKTNAHHIICNNSTNEVLNCTRLQQTKEP
jgi:hypothetical protein